MEKPDLTKMQEDFLKTASDFSSRFTRAWTESMKSAQAQATQGSYEKPLTQAADPLALLGMLGAAMESVRSQSILAQALDDLAELVNCSDQPDKVDRIRQKWTGSYEKFLRDAVAAPGSPESSDIMEQWRVFVNRLSEFGAGSGGSFPPNRFPAEGITSPAGMYADWLATLADEHRKLWEGPFQMKQQSLSMPFQQAAKKALQAQDQYLKALSEFHVRILAVAKAAMDKLLTEVLTFDAKEITPAVCKQFIQVWTRTHETAIEELLRSECFPDAASNVLARGAEARKTMEELINLCLSGWKSPEQKDLESLSQDAYNMEKRIRLLELEVERLKLMLEKPQPPDPAQEQAT